MQNGVIPLKLCDSSLKNHAYWKNAGFMLPLFNRERVIAATSENPVWIHFGAGNIFRAFPAALQQKLLDDGTSDRGIIVCEGYDTEIIERVYKPYDDLSLLVVLQPDGGISKKVIASVTMSLTADAGSPDWRRLMEIFAKPSLQVASFTITEKGYSLNGPGGDFHAAVAADFDAGPASPSSFMGKVAALCYERYAAGRHPLAFLSLDNCSHNGEKLYQAISAFAREWIDRGLADAGFMDYIDSDLVSFPWSMIDKITPRPDPGIREILEKDGFESTEIICTSKNTYIAPFVNAEEPEYLVVEDAFPNGRPPLERAGVIFTDRDTVNRAEKMKVCTCLNPLHTALAIFGCLLGYESIAAEMKNPFLKALVERIGYEEGLPVVIDPGIISPRDFIREVIEVRLPNPYVPDTPQRIATDTSQKIPVRFGETLKAYSRRKDLSISDLTYIPLVFAGWCRYLMGVDDSGALFEPSSDPLLEKMRRHVSGIALGDRGPFSDRLRPILSDDSIFGINLYDAGLGEKTEGFFEKMVSGAGSVRALLEEKLA
jgi:fructuronate reductase